MMMADTANDEGKAAAERRETLDACPYPRGSADHRAWTDGWQTGQGAAEEARADAPFEQARGLTSDELADVIGADDYEAGADQLPPDDKQA